jgi:hypothetical protein
MLVQLQHPHLKSTFIGMLLQHLMQLVLMQKLEQQFIILQLLQQTQCLYLVDTMDQLNLNHTLCMVVEQASLQKFG